MMDIKVAALLDELQELSREQAELLTCFPEKVEEINQFGDKITILEKELIVLK